MKVYNSQKATIMQEMAEIPQISLTTDLWTSIDQTGYMVITAHYINREWELIKRIIGFKPLPSPHTGTAISDRILETLSEWNSTEKCMSITLDNASTNDAAMKRLKMAIDKRRPGGLNGKGAYFHIRCAAHVINLVVKDGLQTICNGVSKLRNSVKYIRGSPARKQAFGNAIETSGVISDKEPATDVPTRWNSTYLMIDSCLPFRVAFESLAVTDSAYLSCPDPNEWDELLNMHKFLSVFHTGEL
jgi:hypothetical protein